MKSYLSYLYQTLGLDHVILPNKDVNSLLSPQKEKSSPTWHFHVVSAKSLTLEEEELFRKIIAALKLDKTSYSTAVGVQVAPAPITVLFTDVPEGLGVWHEQGAHKVLHTHSLSSMLKDAKLKKECWAHLQTIKNH